MLQLARSPSRVSQVHTEIFGGWFRAKHFRQLGARGDQINIVEYVFGIARLFFHAAKCKNGFFLHWTARVSEVAQIMRGFLVVEHTRDSDFSWPVNGQAH